MGVKNIKFAITLLVLTMPAILCNAQTSVDMGTSVLWADRNVGASTPIDAGGYYCWGEVEEKSSYTNETMKYWSSEGDLYFGTYLKYVPNSGDDGYDGKSRLESCDDAAAQNHGGTWRTPTMKEQEELINACTWKIIVQNGVMGYLASSKITGRTLFFPLRGYKASDELEGYGERGVYLSSDVRKDMCFESLSMFFFSKEDCQKYNYNEAPRVADDAFRKYGYSVRGVKNR